MGSNPCKMMTHPSYVKSLLFFSFFGGDIIYWLWVRLFSCVLSIRAMIVYVCKCLCAFAINRNVKLYMGAMLDIIECECTCKCAWNKLYVWRGNESMCKCASILNVLMCMKQVVYVKGQRGYVCICVNVCVYVCLSKRVFKVWVYLCLCVNVCTCIIVYS